MKFPKLLFPSPGENGPSPNSQPSEKDFLASASLAAHPSVLAFQEKKFHLNHPATHYEMAASLRDIIRAARLNGKDIVILCIGTDRSTGDALGPLAGSKLKALNVFPSVYGTLDEPVHATNLAEHLALIKGAHEAPFVIAIDACLGKQENIGVFTIAPGALKPGAAVKKNLPAVGDAYITGVVNVGGFMEHMILQSTRLNLVIKMADTIAYSLSFGLGSAGVKH